VRPPLARLARGRHGLLLGLVFLAPPPVKKLLLRLCCEADIAPSARIGWLSSVVGRRVVLGPHSRVAACTLVRCGGAVELGAHAEVSSFTLVYGAASFRLGRHGYVGPQCLVNADEDVRIGDLSALGPRSMVFTHGSFLPATEGYPTRLAGVRIGERSWLAAGVFVHPGVTVGDDVLVNSRAVVTQDLPAGCAAEGVPARPVQPLARLRRRMTPARVDEVVRRMLERFAETELRRDLGLDVRADGAVLRFRWRRARYALVRTPAAAPAPAPLPDADRVVVVSAGPAPAGAPGRMVIDLRAMRTAVPTDPIHARLVAFMLRYYGIHLEYGAPPAAAEDAAALPAPPLPRP
jgi:acetyltransferase-like isoleucine patch superfamily enzyme